jgi:hypothetical protein
MNTYIISVIITVEAESREEAMEKTHDELEEILLDDESSLRKFYISTCDQAE